MTAHGARMHRLDIGIEIISMVSLKIVEVTAISTMGCHKGGGRICAGWAAVEGFDAIGLRLAAMRGTYDPDKLNINGLELYGSMREMIEANNEVYVAQGQEPINIDGIPG